MLYLASGVLCVDSSENQLEEFGNFQKDCGFIRKYAGLLQIHNILENPQISNMNSDFVPASTVSQQRAYPLYLWPRSKVWIRAYEASVQTAATKVINIGIGSLCERLFI